MKVHLKLSRAKQDEIRKERDAMKKEIDAFRLETLRLRGHIKDAAIREEQLNTVRAKCDEIKKQRYSEYTSQFLNINGHQVGYIE
jgi:Tfp pilus assembly protein PilP